MCCFSSLLQIDKSFAALWSSWTGSVVAPSVTRLGVPEETQHAADAATCPQACPWLTSNPETRANSALFVKHVWLHLESAQVLAGTICISPAWQVHKLVCAQTSQMHSVRVAPSLFSWMLLGLVITNEVMSGFAVSLCLLLLFSGLISLYSSTVADCFVSAVCVCPSTHSLPPIQQV